MILSAMASFHGPDQEYRQNRGFLLVSHDERHKCRPIITLHKRRKWGLISKNFQIIIWHIYLTSKLSLGRNEKAKAFHSLENERYHKVHCKQNLGQDDSVHQNLFVLNFCLSTMVLSERTFHTYGSVSVWICFQLFHPQLCQLRHRWRRWPVCHQYKRVQPRREMGCKCSAHSPHSVCLRIK